MKHREVAGSRTRRQVGLVGPRVLLGFGRREPDRRIHLLQHVERDALLRGQVRPGHLQVLAPACVVLTVEHVETQDALAHRFADRLERDAGVDADGQEHHATNRSGVEVVEIALEHALVRHRSNDLRAHAGAVRNLVQLESLAHPSIIACRFTSRLLGQAAQYRKDEPVLVPIRRLLRTDDVRE